MTGATLDIEGRRVGSTEPVLVIAEIGVNHDGSVSRALELVDIARRCGADAVKLQLFNATTLMHASSSFATYQKDRVTDTDPASMLRRYELSTPDVERVVHAIRDGGMIPIATPFSPPDVDVTERLRLPALKIASPDLVNRVLLKRAVRSGVPLLLSTGAALMQEVHEAVQWLDARHASFALLHCVSSYPTPPDMTNLCWIPEISSAFGHVTGYSDHATDVMCGALGVACGACIVEKHLTYDRTAPGPDHLASADPDQFAEYVRLIRSASTLRGSPGKCVLDVEADVRSVSRQSLVLTRDVQVGERVTESHLTAQRPGKGISAQHVDDVIGAVAQTTLPAGTMLQWNDLERVRHDVA
jgi:sialic acid synthase SpsE